MSTETIRAAAATLAPWGLRFADAGWRLYVVGGAVRSLLAGAELADGDEVDMTTDAPPGEIKRLLDGWAEAIWTGGERFGTVGCRLGDRIVEVTTHRAEVYTADSRRPRVSYGTDLEADLARRDFTIGAMAFEVPSDAAAAAGVRLIDPFDGRGDLEAGLLRTPRAAELSFDEDPLRMLRAGRFVATLGLEVDPPTERAMSRLRGRLEIVSVERCARELSLLLLADGAAAGVDLLSRTGVLAELIPELGSGPTAPPGAVTAPLEAVGTCEALRLAALLWSADDVEAVARRLRFTGAVARRAGAVAAAARATFEVAPTPPRDDTVRRWAAAAGGAAAAAMQLACAVAPTDTTLAAFADRWRRLAGCEDLEARPPLSGSEVMEHLGIGAGPDVGAALGHLDDLRIAGGPLSAEQARLHLTEWWDRRAARRSVR